VTAIIGFLCLKERIRSSQWIGVILILVGVALVNVR
jgi:drug/metabolite transporter (DMT)-like permease